MTGLADAQAILQAARDRGDTRAIHSAQRTLSRLMTQQLRREVEQRKGKPFWRKLWGRR